MSIPVAMCFYKRAMPTENRLVMFLKQINVYYMVTSNQQAGTKLFTGCSLITCCKDRRIMVRFPAADTFFSPKRPFRLYCSYSLLFSGMLWNLRSRCVMVITICVIFMCIDTKTMQFSTAFTTFTLVFSWRPTFIFVTLQATAVKPVASNTASKLHWCVLRNGPALKVWPADSYGSCGVLEEHTKIFITLKEIRTDTKNMLLFLSSVYSI